MLWVVVMAVIAVLGLVMVGCLARWLWHKASDLMAEVAVVTGQLDQLGDLLAQIEAPTPANQGLDRSVSWVGPAAAAHDDEDDEDDDWAAEAREFRRNREAMVSTPTATGGYAEQPQPGQST